MKFAAVVIDTNVVVAGLLTGNTDSPTARILDGMCKGAFPFLLSTALLAEYREVLLRKKIRKLHGLSERDVEALLVALATNAIVRAGAANRSARYERRSPLVSCSERGELRAVDRRPCVGGKPAAQIACSSTAAIHGFASRVKLGSAVPYVLAIIGIQKFTRRPLLSPDRPASPSRILAECAVTFIDVADYRTIAVWASSTGL